VRHPERSPDFRIHITSDGTRVRPSAATRHRVSPELRTPSAAAGCRSRLGRHTAAAVGDLARDLSMKIDPELSGSEGISRVGRLAEFKRGARRSDQSIAVGRPAPRPSG